MSDRTLIHAIMFVLLGWIMSLFMLNFTRFMPFERPSFFAFSIFCGFVLSIFMVKDISSQPTKLQEMESFTGYMLCYVAFQLTKLGVDRFSDTDYSVCIAAAVYLILLLMIYAAQKKRNNSRSF